MKEPGESIGNIGLTSDDNVLLVCAKYGIAKGSFTDGTIEYILMYNHNEVQKNRLRSNDGLIDPWGHLWIGVMSDFPIVQLEGQEAQEGKLYRVNCHDLTIDVMLEDCFIPNGLAFSADRKKLYFTDSLTNAVWEYDYDYIPNKLSNKRVVLNFKDYLNTSDAVPDGLAISKNEDIFSAVYNGSMVLKYTTTGRILQKFNLPAERITCVTIGGKDYDELYITSANENLTNFDIEIDANDKSGDLGGFLYRIALGESLNGHIMNTWGGKLKKNIPV
ncbi:uncharacterized protein PRCAT00003643001 [Priceomyces carsonii]|uniref:uncharacterized protein n=1 Tax=Priceomyces carsonii TaxID=28549 RepID=UPI002EDA2429|nr:unnamed protein product [Priceomyces carsonii]